MRICSVVAILIQLTTDRRLLYIKITEHNTETTQVIVVPSIKGTVTTLRAYSNVIQSCLFPAMDGSTIVCEIIFGLLLPYQQILYIALINLYLFF